MSNKLTYEQKQEWKQKILNNPTITLSTDKRNELIVFDNSNVEIDSVQLHHAKEMPHIIDNLLNLPNLDSIWADKYGEEELIEIFNMNMV